MKLGLLTVTGLAVVLAAPTFAQQAPKCDGPQDACQKIMDLAKQYDAAANNNDAAALAAEFTSDALIVQPGPIVSGKEAIAKHYVDTMNMGHWSNHLVTFNEVHVMGNMAWAAGSWKTNGPGPNNTTQQYAGNWSAIYAEEGGGPKLRVLTFNMNPPEQAAASTATNR